MKRTYRKIKRTIRNWWECRTKRCDYYDHYLAYGPAELTHEGYHSAIRKCQEVQQRDEEYMRNHPEATNSPYSRESGEWEKRVRA